MKLTKDEALASRVLIEASARSFCRCAVSALTVLLCVLSCKLLIWCHSRLWQSYESRTASHNVRLAPIPQNCKRSEICLLVYENLMFTFALTEMLSLLHELQDDEEF